MSEFEELLTWRASCAEEPPKGSGNVEALCHATARTSNGSSRMVFFWERRDGANVQSGFEFCPAGHTGTQPETIAHRRLLHRQANA
jgi:hypothetical protein